MQLQMRGSETVNYISTSRHLSETMEKLMQKLDSLKVEGGSDVRQTARISAALDNLEEMLAQVERQRTNETKLMQKFEHLMSRVENVNGSLQGETQSKKNMQETFSTIIKGTKTLGQVIEVIANTAEVLVESIYNVINENQSALMEDESNTKTQKQLDLSGILQPINDLVRGLAAKKEVPRETTSNSSVAAGD